MNNKRFWIITIGIFTGLILIVVMFYLINFSSQTLSDKTSDWGTFGDYFGGILNPFIGILNLMALIYISFTISNLEETRNLNDLTSQKKFALYSLQHDSLKVLSGILEKVQDELIRSDENSRLNIILIRNEFNAFITTHSYLFRFFEERTWEPLRDMFVELSELSFEVYVSKRSDETTEKLLDKLPKFNDLKIQFIQEVQDKIEI